MVLFLNSFRYVPKTSNYIAIEGIIKPSRLTRFLTPSLHPARIFAPNLLKRSDFQGGFFFFSESAPAPYNSFLASPGKDKLNNHLSPHFFLQKVKRILDLEFTNKQHNHSGSSIQLQELG